MRKQIGAILYGPENQVGKSNIECINSEEVWEDFEKTFFKNELIVS